MSYTKYKGVDIVVYIRIRELRKNLHLTQTEIAEKLNLSQRTYSRYETGDRAIPIKVLSKLADFHGTSIDYLVGHTDERQPHSQKKQDNC